MTVEERLELLERELKLSNRRNRLLPGVLLCMSIPLTVWMVSPQSLLGQNAANPVKEVRANRFVLEDEKGKVRAVLATDGK